MVSHCGFLDDLALCAKVQARARPSHHRSKTARATRTATKLIHKQQFALVANLAGNLGIADATANTLESLRHLFQQQNVVLAKDLLDYYGPTTPPNPDNPPVSGTLDTLRSCLADAPPL